MMRTPVGVKDMDMVRAEGECHRVADGETDITGFLESDHCAVGEPAVNESPVAEAFDHLYCRGD
jgi:hypothetical protein